MGRVVPIAEAGGGISGVRHAQQAIPGATAVVGAEADGDTEDVNRIGVQTQHVRPGNGRIEHSAQLEERDLRVVERSGDKKGIQVRLQTTDRGAAVSQFTVSRELGHGGDSLVKRVYGHLGNVNDRHRSEHVEFRVEQHSAALADRLSLLRVT